MLPSAHIANDSVTPGVERYLHDVPMLVKFGQDKMLNSQDVLMVFNAELAKTINTGDIKFRGYFPTINPFRTNDFALDQEQTVAMNSTPRVLLDNFDGRISGDPIDDDHIYTHVYDFDNGYMTAESLGAIQQYYFYFVGDDSYNGFIPFSDQQTLEFLNVVNPIGTYDANSICLGLNTGALLNDDAPFYPIRYYAGIAGEVMTGTDKDGNTLANERYIVSYSDKPSFYMFTVDEAVFVNGGVSVNGSDIWDKHGLPVTGQDLVRMPGVLGMDAAHVTRYHGRDSVAVMLKFVKDHGLHSYILGSVGAVLVTSGGQRLPIAGSAFTSGKQSPDMYDMSMYQLSMYKKNQAPM